MIVIVFGLPGSGKSFFAEKLAIYYSAVYLSSDRLRKKMFSVTTYTKEEKQAVYEEMIHQLRKAMEQKLPVVLDATFHKIAYRKMLLKDCGAMENVSFIEVEASETIIRQRLSQSRKDSEADFSVYKRIKSEWEPMEEEHLKLESTNTNIEEMLDVAIQYLSLK